ncbi:MAG TPA: cell wall hydrolase [Caulobacteraceae bacterium]|nr:cell wall hydrolase [Caulobacteraceae bacterium]
MSDLWRWAAAAASGVVAVAITSSAASQNGRDAVPIRVATATAPAVATPVLQRPGLAGPSSIAQLVRLVETRPYRLRAVDANTRCMAKVVRHEAGNQPLRGQLAVAEVIVNRMKSATFPDSACAVASQPGQFAAIAGYHAVEDGNTWRTAVAVSRLAQSAHAPRVVPGALFFHAAYVRPGWGRRHTRIARIGDQIFYR